MKVKEVIEQLKTFNQEADFLISCDEELNTLYSGSEISELDTDEQVVIYGLNGTEIEEEYSSEPFTEDEEDFESDLEKIKKEFPVPLDVADND